MKKQQAFTLFEVLITISIIAIIAVIAVPSFQHLITSQRRAVAKQRLLHALQFARSMAINTQQPVVICPTNDKRHCVADWQQPLMIYVDKQKKAERDGEDKLLRYIGAGAYGKLALSAFPTKRYFRFLATGFTDAQNGTFSFCYRQQGWQLVINRAGRVRTQKLTTC